MKFILRLAINMVALYVAIVLLPKYILYQGNWIDIIWLALIFGLVNAILRPPFKALSCLLIILTLGLFTLVINTLLFALTGWVGSQFGVGFDLASAVVLERLPRVVGHHSSQHGAKFDIAG